jgi:quinol monooxygenase YgiN
MGRILLLARHTHYRLDAFIRDVQVLKMDSLSNFVSLHPYFKVHPGKLDAFKAALPAFIEKTATEEKNLFYGFSINGDEILCREGYKDAEGVLGHLENVGALLAEALKISDLIRVELHGPAQELDKLKGPLAHLNPAWFTLEFSVGR